MAAPWGEFKRDPRTEFMLEGDAGREHEGVIQGMDYQGRSGDGGQETAATGLAVIVVDAGEAAQGGGDPVIELVEIIEKPMAASGAPSGSRARWVRISCRSSLAPEW